MSDRYCDIGTLKTRLGITDTTDDVSLNAMIEAVSRIIDELTQRRFYASTETRYYQATDAYRIYVDDLLSVTTLKTDYTSSGTWTYTWTTSDYDLGPVNASADGWPYLYIERKPYGDYYFPITESVPRSIQVVGSFGFSSTVPDMIGEAALLASEQVFKRKDAIFGVMGPAGFLQNVKNMLTTDPLISLCLAPYTKRY